MFCNLGKYCGDMKVSVILRQKIQILLEKWNHAMNPPSIWSESFFKHFANKPAEWNRDQWSDELQNSHRQIVGPGRAIIFQTFENALAYIRIGFYHMLMRRSWIQKETIFNWHIQEMKSNTPCILK